MLLGLSVPADSPSRKKPNPGGLLSLSENPYESPHEHSRRVPDSGNTLGRVGFVLSLVALLGLLAVGPFGSTVNTFGMCISFVCLPGLVTSVVALRHRPRRLAGWGIAVGIFVALYLPTFYLSMFVFGRR